MMIAVSRRESRVVSSVLFVHLLLWCFVLVKANEISTEAPDVKARKLSGDILTAEGEVAIDYEKNKLLPEELDDGELEAGDTHTSWNYLDQTRWAGEYPKCQSASLRQSPIDIVTDKAIFGPNLKLEFVDYDQYVEFELKNTHHSVSLTPIPALSKPGIHLNFVDGEADYELQEIHFHWGDGVNKGSEHEINDKRAAAERTKKIRQMKSWSHCTHAQMHMVHYRAGIDKSQIGNVENSVAVIGVMIESDSVEHNKLEPIVKKTEYVNGTDAEYKDTSPFNLLNLLPAEHHGFYTYNGSLTTPPCYEVVTWLILSEPVYMSQERLIELSNLEAALPKNGGRKKIAQNCRDVQPLLNRPVYASFNVTDKSTYMKLDTQESQQEHLEKNGLTTNLGVRKAMLDYWKKINALQGTVRQTFAAIESARQELWIALKSKMFSATRTPSTTTPTTTTTTKTVRATSSAQEE